MQILLITIGERISDSGLYRSQVINMAREFSKITTKTTILSLVPILNTDLLTRRGSYAKYIKGIHSLCRQLNISLHIFFLPYSSHSQYIGKAFYFALWDNPLVLWLLRVIIRGISPDVVSCRGLLASYLVCKAFRGLSRPIINYDLRGNSRVEASLLYSVSAHQKNRIQALQDYALSHCDSVTSVSDVLAAQCNVPSHKCHITQIASSMPLVRFVAPSIADCQSHIYFLTIGSLSKSWYPMSEFDRVSTGIHAVLVNSANIILAPPGCHRDILNYPNYGDLCISKLDSFSSESEAAKLAHRCLFGLLPYRQPLDCEVDLTQLAATVMSTKLSDYLLLGIIPIVPAWCTAAASFVVRHEVGIVYDSAYSFAFLSEPDLLERIQLYRSNILRVRHLFTAQSIADRQLRHFSQYL
jgi:hypothetical protein